MKIIFPLHVSSLKDSNTDDVLLWNSILFYWNIYSYITDHYSFWENELDSKIGPGAFGENLSLAGINENHIYVGDIFSLGTAKIEVSQPRQPCHKLNKVFEFQGMACKVQTTGYTGCYFRVIKKGWVFNPKMTIFD